MKIANIKRGFKLAGLTLKKHSPQIMVFAGCAGAIGGCVLACKETLKLEETLDNCKEEINFIEVTYAQDEEYDEKEYKKDLTVQTLKNAASVAKLYAPAVILETTSIALILGSNNIMRKRNASLAAAYATLDTIYKRYRKSVVDTFGKDIDHDMRYGITHEKVDTLIIDENGKEKHIKKTADIVTERPEYSEYARFFMDVEKGYDPNNPEYNKLYLKGIENYCNDLLRANGYLFLNDVYKQLGFEPSVAGQSVGWIYDEKNPIGDNYVDFGIFEVYNANAVNELEPVFLLDFNVDGDILNDPRLKLWRI